MFRPRPKHLGAVWAESAAMTIEALRTVQIKFAARGAAFLRDALHRLGEWHQTARTRRQLAILDDRALRDIGLTPAHREAECRKPFWL
jgi:uncharacterized protein YjiS (DUF1127 family)